ncbi:MAG TPA: amidohydrolase family protein [Bacteroidia bacterium]|nr:amidohydrolase family protein [Bacteroidia bacterium]
MNYLKKKFFIPFITCLFFSFNLYSQKTYIWCGSLLDIVNEKMLSEMTIIVENNKIFFIEKGYSNAGINDKVIDLKNKTVLPGLIDMHVHLDHQQSKTSHIDEFTTNIADIAYRSVTYSEKTLLAGFTTVRDLGGETNISLREAIKKGTIKGPRIFTAGIPIGATGGHSDPSIGYRDDLMGDPGITRGVANGADECRKAVRQQYKRGADLIKVMATGGVLSLEKNGSGPQYSEEELKAIVETAKDLGLKVAAHAHGAEGIKRAAKAGVSSIEHGSFMDDECIDLMKKFGTYYIPTLLAGNSVTDSAMVTGYFPEPIRTKAMGIAPAMKITFSKAYKAGVKIAFGTDAGVFPHGRNAKELQLMVEYGMPAMTAIKCATLTAAELLDEKDKLGSVETGKFADIIAVDGNPLNDIKILQDVKFVMKDGVVFKN